MDIFGYLLVLMVVVCGGHCLVMAVRAIRRGRPGRSHPADAGDEKKRDNEKGCH